MEPLISVVIPVYNDPQGLENTLKSLVNQSYLYKDFEVIVCDNASKDNTPEVAKDYAKKYPKIIKVVIENKIQSSYAARNKGIKVARGTIIAFIDADMTVKRDYIKRIAEIFEKDREINYMGCNVEIYLEDNNVFGIYDKITGFPVERYVKYSNFAPTCCLVVKRNVFEKVGLFDERLISGGDFEFGNRVCKNGIKLFYSSKIVLKHPARSSFKKLSKKYFRIGRGIRQLALYYPEYRKEFKRNIFNPYYYLPLPRRPRRFFSYMKNNRFWVRLTFSIKVCFYLIKWLSRLANHIGYVYEDTKSK